jgi:hypothetical protein
MPTSTNPVTCSHVPITKAPFEGLTLVRCLHCATHWREAPIYIDDDEYDLWLVILDLYLPRKTS